MAAVLDHIFICTRPGAPAADLLRRQGLVEGPPNTHPGQGTACRRFFFPNFTLELIWLADAAEAQSPRTRPTRLWERCSAPGPEVSPFGIILRPGADGPAVCPFPSWRYAPPAMPGLDLRIASGTTLAEPMWCYTDPYPRRAPQNSQSLKAVRLTGRRLPPGCVTEVLAAQGVIQYQPGKDHMLELDFD